MMAMRREFSNPPDNTMTIPTTDPVPGKFRGVWRRSLLRTPRSEDTTTTVYWMQTARWHADIRVPAGRPDFSGVHSLADCSATQLQWLATQEGFAGVTRVDPRNDDTAWLRVVDFQPPSALPDEGHAVFKDGMLVETGIHADYLEHWHLLPRSTDGACVMQRLQATAPEWLLVAGQCVMLVRSRASAFEAAGWGRSTALREQLDFEISFGERSAEGWTIHHSTLPWREGQAIALSLQEADDGSLDLVIDGEASRWGVLEWTPPSA